MKKTIALLMIVFLPQAHAHWEEFVRSPDGEMAHYYDATKVLRDRGQTTFRLPIKVEFQSPVVALNGGLGFEQGFKLTASEVPVERHTCDTVCPNHQ